jgi:formylglycine-generating enzyme required for sulfatase activity
MAQFRAFVDETKYQTDAENPAGNRPGRIGGHGWSAEHHRFEGWFPQYTWRNSGWPLTDQHPASNISWNDAAKFCEWLAAKSGWSIRLPTTLEWDRAARAGTRTAYFTGEDPASLEGYANVRDPSLLRAIAPPGDAGAASPSTTGTRSHLPWRRSNPIHGACTT